MKVSLLFLMVGSALAAEVPVWPQWRGPKRDGVSPGTPWPDKLDAARLRQTWRVELAAGYPGPVVAADRVFVAESRDRKVECVRALDRATGRELWKTEWEGYSGVPFFARENGDWIRSTPAFDGESLYVGGMRDVLVCLNAADGSVRWRVDFVKDCQTPVPAFGLVCSPLLVGDAVYVQAAAGLVKLDKKTGSVLWRSLQDGGGMWGSAFSSPVFARLGGTDQIVVQTREKLAGVDTVDGTVLWEKAVPAFRGMNILTPAIQDGRIFTSAYGGRSHLFEVARDGEKLKVTQVWDGKHQAYMCSPVVVGGFAYLLLKNRHFACLDLKTGAERWVSPATFGRYQSLVARGNRILALDERGTLFLFAADPEKFVQLDSRKVSDAETWGHLAVAGDEVFVRELNAVSAWRWTSLP